MESLFKWSAVVVVAILVCGCLEMWIKSNSERDCRFDCIQAAQTLDKDGLTTCLAACKTKHVWE